MNIMIPYITIPGSCEDALNFYKNCFSGEIVFLQRYIEIEDYPVSKEYEMKIAHSEFCADGIHFFASDGVEGQHVISGNNIALSVSFDTKDKQLATFEKLKVDGEITMGFSETSVNSILVTHIDKYGIHWALNYDHD